MRVKLPARTRSGHSPMKVHNIAIVKATLAGFTEKTVKPYLAKILGEVADAAIEYIQGNFSLPGGTNDFPVYSANMRDATGVGVYCDSVLMAYRPPKEATKLQHMGSEFVNISGSENLEKALTLGCSKYTDGIWIVLFSAVPYAERVNDLGSPKMRGARYFDKFESWLLAEVKSRVSGINNFPVGFHYE